MDERQAAIKEGEGLTESRLNTDFLEFIKKWGMHALLVAAILALSYRGWQFLEQRRVARVDDAFRQLEAAGPASTANPRALLDLAADFEGTRSVAILARLRAADAYMVAVRRGVHPGAVLNAEGQLESQDDLIDEADRALFLDNAEREYNTVRQQTTGKPKLAIHELNALYGLAAVAESRGNLDAAKAYYEEVIALAKSQNLEPHPEIAQHRIDTLPELEQVPHLYTMAELPTLTWQVPEIDLDQFAPDIDPGAVGPQVPDDLPQDPPTDPGGDDDGAGGDEGGGEDGGGDDPDGDGGGGGGGG